MIKLLLCSCAVVSSVIGLWSFSKLRNHVIATLLRLEFASLSVYLYLVLLISRFPGELFITLVYLTMAACEGALGLSILVIVIKTAGNDYLKINNLAQC